MTSKHGKAIFANLYKDVKSLGVIQEDYTPSSNIDPIHLK